MGFWKEDWDKAQSRLEAWWAHKGLALYVTAPKDEPWEALAARVPPATEELRKTDPVYRVAQAAYDMAHTYFGGVAFPYFDSEIGPGSLGTFLGSEPVFSPETVWYLAVEKEPEDWPELRFDPASVWFRKHLDMLEYAAREARGRFLVGMPDLIENVDTLAQLRDNEALMMDFVERPEWVNQKIFEINRAFYAAFDALIEPIRDERGGNAFSAFKVWGPGRTAKVQCDASAMFSPAMFAEFVVPALSEQCDWLDYSIFHLDGTQCLCHLDLLLGIESLDAIEWTPQPVVPSGGDPTWYEFYRRVKAGGKSVQAIGVRYEEVLPLIDAVSPEGLFVMTSAPSESAARELVSRAYG